MTNSVTFKAQQSPDQEVENRILTRLEKEFSSEIELISKLRGKLASGAMKTDDWKLGFELALARPQKPAGEKP